MQHYIKLLRVHHILAFGFLFSFLRYFILVPLLRAEGQEIFLTDSLFMLLILSVLLIAAGGYAINNYFNLKSDAINKPSRVVIGKTISRTRAVFLHVILSSLGILLFFVFSYCIQQLVFGLLGIIAVGILWYYSNQYKYQFLVGNIVLALLSTSPFFLILITEQGFIQLIATQEHIVFNVLTVLCLYGGFVFLLSLVLSIVKDIEDVSGDLEMNANTLPIQLGIKYTMYIVSVLIAILVGIVIYVITLMYQGNAQIQLYYAISLLLMPLLIAFLLSFTIKDSIEVKKIKRVLTLLVYTGIISIPFFYYF